MAISVLIALKFSRFAASLLTGLFKLSDISILRIKLFKVLGNCLVSA